MSMDSLVRRYIAATDKPKRASSSKSRARSSSRSRSWDDFKNSFAPPKAPPLYSPSLDSVPDNPPPPPPRPPSPPPRDPRPSSGTRDSSSSSWDDFVDSFDPPTSDPLFPSPSLDPIADDTSTPDLVRGLTPEQHEVERIRAGMAGYDYDPAIGWISKRPPATTSRVSTINRVSRRTQQEQSLQLAGDGALVGLPFGRVRVGARLLSVWDDSTNNLLVVLLGWAFGGRTGVESIEKVYINDEDKTSETTWWEHYTGQPGAANYNTVDSAILAADVTYDDTGVYVHPDTANNVADAYSVLKLPYSAQIDGFPECEAIIKGLRFYDPREAGHVLATPTTWEYTTNPSIILGNVLYSPEFGAGLTVDWTSVDAMADINDGLVNGKKRHEVGLFVQENNSLDTLIEALRGYAGCFVRVEGSTAYLVPDRPASVSRTLTKNEIADTISIRMAQREPVPSHVRVWYTDRQSEPWQDRYAEYDRSAGDYAITEIYMRGFDTHERAYRFGKDWANHRLLDSLLIEYETTAQGAKDTPGDVVEITHPIGNLSAYDIRLIQVRMSEPGVWFHRGLTYDANAYTDDDVTATPAPTPQLPDPLTPVQVTGMSLSQGVYTDADEITRLRTKINFTAADWAFAEGYHVTFKLTSETDFLLDIIVPHTAGNTYAIVTPNIKGGVSYRAEVITLGPYGNSAAVSVQTFLASLAVTPDDPSSAAAVQVSNDVKITWSAPNDPNVVAYAVRRGTTSQTVSNWSSMTFVSDLIDSEIIIDLDPPVSSTTRYFVRSISHAGGLSINASTADIDVVEVNNTNLLYSGDFPSWQEGTSFTPTVGTYVADLWEVFRQSNQTGWTVSRQSARTNGLGAYSLRIQRTNGDTNTGKLNVSYAFETEEVVALRGKWMTIDFWIQTGANFTGGGTSLVVELRTSDTNEASFAGLTSATTQSLACDGTDLPNISTGTNNWTRITGSWANAVSSAATGLGIRIQNAPTGTAGANDWFDITEVQLFVGDYYDSLDSNDYKQAPDFVVPPSSAVAARIQRYLRYDQSSGQAAQLAHSMRATPTETGSSAPYQYDARL